MVNQVDMQDALAKLAKSAGKAVKDERRVRRDAGIEIDTPSNLAGGPLSPAPTLIGPQGSNTT